MEHIVSATNGLGERFLSLYDPNDYFGVLGVNRDRFLLEWLDVVHEKPTNVFTKSGMVGFSGRPLIGLELAHTMLITPGNYRDAQGLGLSIPDLDRSIQTATFGAQHVVRGVLKAAEVLLEDPSSLISQRAAKRDPWHLILAGAVLAGVSHRGEKRKNGQDYVNHVLAAASALGIAARKSKTKISPEDTFELRRDQYGALNHDGFEDSFVSDGPERGRSFLASDKVVPSPLTHYLLLCELGLTPQQAWEDAQDIIALTRSVGPDGSMIYPRYTPHILRRPRAKVKKAGDVSDNLIFDPNRVWLADADEQARLNAQLAIDRINRKYGEFLPQLRLRHDEIAPDITHRVSKNLHKVQPHDLDDFKGSTRLINLLTNEVLLDAWDRGQELLAT